MWSEAAIALTLFCQSAIAVPGDVGAEAEAVSKILSRTSKSSLGLRKLEDWMRKQES